MQCGIVASCRGASIDVTRCVHGGGGTEPKWGIRKEHGKNLQGEEGLLFVEGFWLCGYGSGLESGDEGLIGVVLVFVE